MAMLSLASSPKTFSRGPILSDNSSQWFSCKTGGHMHMIVFSFFPKRWSADRQSWWISPFQGRGGVSLYPESGWFPQAKWPVATLRVSLRLPQPSHRPSYQRRSWRIWISTTILGWTEATPPATASLLDLSTRNLCAIPRCSRPPSRRQSVRGNANPTNCRARNSRVSAVHSAPWDCTARRTNTAQRRSARRAGIQGGWRACVKTLRVRISGALQASRACC